jgi:Spy/CpxP family protein refolding chaperone
MKSRFLAVAVLSACGMLARAQDAAPPGPDAQRETPAQRMDHLATLLDLTDAQKVQVEAILKEEHAKGRAAFETAKDSGQKPSFDEMKSQHQALEQETLTKLTPVLNANQLKKFQIIMEHHGPGPGLHPHQ